MAKAPFRTTLRFDKSTGRMVDITPRSQKKIISRIQRSKVQLKRSRVVRRGNASWPVVSENAGVMPEQVDEARGKLRELGISGVEYLNDGRVVWYGPEARKQHLKSIGAYDRNGYY